MINYLFMNFVKMYPYGVLKMKKISILISLLVFITMLPLTSAITFPIDTNNIPGTVDADPPDWATGGFVGVLGLTNQMGRPESYRGYVAGYYQKEKFNGRFAGVISQRNASEVTGFIGGYIKGPFLIGIIGNISTEEYRPIVGIGLTNQTHTYFRLMSLVGPTFYMACRYQSI